MAFSPSFFRKYFDASKKHANWKEETCRPHFYSVPLPEAADAADGLSCSSDEAELNYRPLMLSALKSIVIRAKCEKNTEETCSGFQK